MVLAALTEYPDLWAAGVDVVGIANFVTFLENTGDWRRELREAEYGSIAEDREFLEEISPINNVEHIEAPLFVLHGENDPAFRSARPNRSPNKQLNRACRSGNSSSKTGARLLEAREPHRSVQRDRGLPRRTRLSGRLLGSVNEIITKVIHDGA